MGSSIWLCPWMKLQHVGRYVFSGTLADLASIGATATANPDELKHIKQKPTPLIPAEKKLLEHKKRA